jgi:hypothetical protein
VPSDARTVTARTPGVVDASGQRGTMRAMRRLVFVVLAIVYYQAEGGTTYSLRIPAGRYDVYLDLESTDVTDYLADPIRVAANVNVHSATTVDVNPQLVSVSGAIRYDDQVITNAYVDYTEALIRFVNRETLNTYLYYHSEGGTTYALKIPQGRYDVFLDLESANVVDYLADPIRVATDVDVQSATTIDVNPQLVEVSGAIRYDDQVITNAYVDYTEALIRFVNRETFNTYLYYQSEGGTTYSLKIPQGRYDVFLDLESADVTDYLSDPIRVATNVDVQSATTVDVNPQLVTVSGIIKYDDQTITNAYVDYTEALVRFTNKDTFSTYLYYQSEGGETYTLKVPQGRYDVFLDLESADVVDYLADPIRVARDIEISDTTTVNVNPQLVEVRGEIRYDDQEITNAYVDYTEALVRFTSRETFSSDLESTDVADYLADPIRVGECVVVE